MSDVFNMKIGGKVSRGKTDWVVFNTAKGSRLECLRCGGHYLPNYPTPVNVMTALSKAFRRDHARCELRPDGLVCCHCGKRGHKPDACQSLFTTDPMVWVTGTDTGTSSKTIWRRMMRRSINDDDRDDVPYDPDDFGRCYRLLKLFPEWRERLGEMRSVPGWVGKAWGRLVDNWQEMERLYEEERPIGRAPKLYALMQRLIDEGRR